MKKVILSIIVVSMLFISSNAMAIVRYHPERDEAQEEAIENLEESITSIRNERIKYYAEIEKIKAENKELKREIKELREQTETFQGQLVNILRIVLTFSLALQRSL